MSSLLQSHAKTLLCLFLFSCSTHAASTLPASPEQISAPYPHIKVQELSSAEQLIADFKQHNYQLKLVTADKTVPSYFVENLPDDLNNLPVEEKTTGFIRLLLPTVKAVNNQILLVRNELKALASKPKSAWTEAEQAWVENLMHSYDVKTNNIEDLLLQVDIIPIGMVLAQGIDESGWGTSHFAVKGNSLYGEHLPAHGGKYLTTPGGHVKVAAFNNLYAGTASYIHNLNTTRAYEQLWQLRKQLREQQNLNGYQLVAALSHYSTRGEAYVDNLRALIKHHQLDNFDQLKLDSNYATRIRFSH